MKSLMFLFLIVIIFIFLPFQERTDREKVEETIEALEKTSENDIKFIQLLHEISAYNTDNAISYLISLSKSAKLMCTKRDALSLLANLPKKSKSNERLIVEHFKTLLETEGPSYCNIMVAIFDLNSSEMNDYFLELTKNPSKRGKLINNYGDSMLACLMRDPHSKIDSFLEEESSKPLQNKIFKAKTIDWCERYRYEYLSIKNCLKTIKNEGNFLLSLLSAERAAKRMTTPINFNELEFHEYMATMWEYKGTYMMERMVLALGHGNFDLKRIMPSLEAIKNAHPVTYNPLYDNDRFSFRINNAIKKVIKKHQ